MNGVSAEIMLIPTLLIPWTAAVAIPLVGPYPNITFGLDMRLTISISEVAPRTLFGVTP